MSIRFKCKNCGQKYELPAKLADRIAECSKCKSAMPIPKQTELPLTDPTGATVYDLKRAQIATLPGMPELRRTKAAKPAPPRYTKSKTEDNVVFWCKVCGQKYRLRKSLSGKVGECSKCGNDLPIPSKSEIAPLIVTPNPHPVPPATPIETHENIHTHSQTFKPPLKDKIPPLHDPNEQKKRSKLQAFKNKLENSLAYSAILLLSEWLWQYKAFRILSRKAAVIALGLTISLILMTAWSAISKPAKAQEVKCEFHVICSKCTHREIRKLAAINQAKCSKCGSAVFQAWYCEDCKKYFPMPDKMDSHTKSRHKMLQKIQQKHHCPFCNSQRIKYASTGNKK
jgi:ribosomal protein L37AE/L43A